MDTNVTIGDALPEDMRDNYPDEVLNVPLSEAVNIAVYDMPPTSDLSEDDIDDIKQIFALYQSEGGPGSESDGSDYWSKTPEQNQTYWNKS